MSTNSNVVDYCAAVVAEAIKGLLGQPKTLGPWLFYDAEGSLLLNKLQLCQSSISAGRSGRF